jgi:putative ABC transport system permease protein
VSRSTEPATKRLAELRAKRQALSQASWENPGPQTPTVAASQLAERSPLDSVIQQFEVKRRGPFAAIGANFESAIDALWGNKTRSILTTLGIFIGVAAVIAALTLTQGVSQYIDNLINSLGTNTIIIYPGSLSSRGAAGSGTAQTLTQNDVDTVLKVPHVAQASPIIMVTGVQVVYGNQNWNTSVEGVTADFQIIQNWTLASGAWFSDSDVQTGTPVAIIGDTVAHSLFDASGKNPVGQTIRIRDQLFHVGGVLQAKGIGQDDVIFVPLSTAHIRLKNVTYVDQIQIAVDARENIKPVESAITTALMKNHHIKPGGTSDFTTFDFTSYLQRAQQQTAIMTLLLVGIAAISLTVGGIGIMNIMLVSVTERTREIGIRMAIGARRQDIQSQFLVEALVLCILGALIGLLLGLLIGRGVTAAFSLPFVITPATLLIPIGVSVGITIIFGIYPAIQASRLDPVEALRIDE